VPCSDLEENGDDAVSTLHPHLFIFFSFSGAGQAGQVLYP
jgi:hypothetical protein